MGEEIDAEEIKESISLVSKFDSYRFETLICPIIRDKNTLEATYMSTNEIAETAKLLLDMTGSRRQPFFLKQSNLTVCGGGVVKAEPLEERGMFKYLNAAREFQVAAEIVR